MFSHIPLHQNFWTCCSGRQEIDCAVQGKAMPGMLSAPKTLRYEFKFKAMFQAAENEISEDGSREIV